MHDTMVSLSTLRDAARRLWWFWLAAAVLGLAVGVAFPVALPGGHTAESDLYLVEPGGATPQAIANDQSLLDTYVVAKRAMADLGLRYNPSAFSYQGTVEGGSILGVKATAASEAAAVKYDNALDRAFLEVRAGELGRQTAILVHGLQGQINALDANISALTASIDALSTAPANEQSASEIAGLVNQRSGDESDASQLQSQIQQDQLSEATVVQGSQVLDPASLVRTSFKKLLATDGLTGLVAGLAIGLGVVALLAVLSERPRRRDDIAAALGAPVELSLGGSSPSRRLRRRALLRALKRPDATLRMVKRRLQANLATSGIANPAKASLAVIEVEAGSSAAAAVGLLAKDLASQGRRVLVIDAANGRPLGSALLRRAGAGTPKTVSLGGHNLTVLVAREDPDELSDVGMPDSVDTVLLLGSADPALGAEYVSHWATKAVVLLTAGKATSTYIEATGRMLRGANVAVSSAVVLGAKGRDESSGLLTDRTVSDDVDGVPVLGDGAGPSTPEGKPAARHAVAEGPATAMPFRLR